jgi:hypothetical protein
LKRLGKTNRSMRVLKIFYVVVLFSISMGLFCGELPETLRLRDDTSNDYVNDSSASAARETEAVREKIPEERVAIRQPLARPVPPTTRSAAGHTVHSGQKLLSLLSIRRT